MARGKMAHHQHSIVGLVPIYLLRAIIYFARQKAAEQPSTPMAASALAALLARHTLKRPFPGAESQRVYVCVTRCAVLSNGSRTGYRAKSMNTCAGTSPPLTHPNNLDGNDHHGGIPVGAVQIESTQFQSFLHLIHRVGDRDASFQNINSKALAFRGVEAFIGPSTYDQSQFQNTIDISKTSKKRSRQLLVHLPTSVAAALNGGHPELMQFLNSHKSTYLPGFRRHPNHPDATRAKRHAMISPYVMPKRAVDVLHRDDAPPRFTYAEFFAGIGGFRLGLDAIGGRCIFANEVDPYAASIYRRNFSLNGHDAKCPLLEADILDLCPIRDNLPIADVDILCGGFPCQSFSVRGDQRALKDARGQGQLYQELCRMLLSARPKSFIFENVPGLVSLDGGWVGRDGEMRDGDQREMKAGRIMAHILAAFENCGYNIEWNVIDAAHWTPQRRKRVYIVGIRNDIAATFSWGWYNYLVSSGGGDKRILRDVLEPKDIANQYKLSDSQWKAVKRIHGDLYENTAFDTQTKSPTLISSYRKGNSFTTKYVFEEEKEDGTKIHRPRYLSPREAARLQGFPEWFTVPTAVSSETEHAHFYKGIGNAVVPPLIEKVGMELVRCIKGVP